MARGSQAPRGARLARFALVPVALLACLALSQARTIAPQAVAESSGYVEARAGAHMFWWLMHSPAPAAPIVLWLQGGPGASSTGFGNFMEIGPEDANLMPRAHSWLSHAHLLFVDNPVGTGFSYVDDLELLATNNTMIAGDLMALLRGFLKAHPEHAGTPLHIFSESYGGKMAAGFADVLTDAIAAGEIACNFKGVALGDSWISGVDYVEQWGPYLKSMSLLDDPALIAVIRAAMAVQSRVSEGDGKGATELWGVAEELISNLTDDVDFYNVLNHHSDGDAAALRAGAEGQIRGAARRHLGRYHEEALSALMNSKIKTRLKIPPEVTWGGQSADVFDHLAGDFMNDVVGVVDSLLAKGVMVTVYNGQLDVICCTPGTEAWMAKLGWPQLKAFNSSPREPIYPAKGSKHTGAFVKRRGNLAMYYVLGAGHMVPSDQPVVALEMLRGILAAGGGI